MSYICYHCFQEKPNNETCPFCGYDPAASEGKYPDALRPGSILNGKYIVGHVLGQGGFGITYIAKDYLSGERVAIKEYLPSEFARRNGSSVQAFSGDQETNFAYGKEQFLAEAKTLAAFNGDEHIVRIFSFFEENNTAYFAMEYVDGYALDKIMAQQGGRLSIAEANRYLLPLMESLNKVHAKGIVHRDIAPDNIIVTKDGSAKLIDFGAARFSTGEKSKSLDVILKHGFAPMEQYMRRGRQGPYTDVYALAVTYYYAITGKIPPDAVERVEQDSLFLPSAMGVAIRKSTEKVLQKALAVSSSDRFQTMAHFHAAMLETMPDYDSPECAIEPEVILKWETQYQKAQKKQAKAKTVSDYQSVIREYEKIKDFRDSSLRISQCEDSISAIERAKEEEKKRKKENSESNTIENREPDRSESKKQGFRIIAALLCLTLVAVAFFHFAIPAINIRNAYKKGIAYREEGRYAEAIEQFSAILDYKDASTQIKMTDYSEGEAHFQEKNWDAAIEAFLRADDYADAETQIQACYYAMGKDKLSIGEWDGAAEAFKKAGNYSNAETMIKEASYQKAASLIQEGLYLDAYLEYISLGSYKDVNKILQSEKLAGLGKWMQGEEVIFGRFEQDNNAGNGKEELEWIVLDVQENRCLLITKYVIDHVGFGGGSQFTLWSKSNIRSWLNTTFYNGAFSENEKKAIITTTNKNTKEQGNGKRDDEDTEDSVFLLSIKEAKHYATSFSLKATTTETAVKHGVKNNEKTGCCTWWLRSATSDTVASWVGYTGAVMGQAEGSGDVIGVRPTMWVDLTIIVDSK